MALTPTSTFSDIMSVTKFSDDDHKDKALKATDSKPLYQKSSLRSHTTRKQAGADFIKASLNREFGAGFGARVFQRVQDTTHKDLNSVVKGRDLADINRAVHRLNAEDVVSATRIAVGDHGQNGITTQQITDLLSVIDDPLVGDGKKLEAGELLHRTLNTANVGTFDAAKLLLAGGAPEITSTQMEQIVNLKAGNGADFFTPAEKARLTDAVTPGAGGDTPGNRTALLRQLPAGATISPTGALGGTTTLPAFAGGFPAMTGLASPSFTDVMNFVGQSALAKEPVTLPSGLEIAPQSSRDFYRLDITVTPAAGPAYSSKAANALIKQNATSDAVVGEQTNDSVATALRGLAGGSAKAVHVISSVLNQQFSTPFVRGITDTSGHEMRPAIAGARAVTVPVADHTGINQVHPGGIGSSPINVSVTASGNYRIDITYRFTMTRPDMNDHGSRFAGLQDSGIQGTGQASIVINAADAANGILTLTEAAPSTITWSGHMV